VNISVVIPTLNATSALRETLHAIAGVTDIVVVDGGSTDATVDIALAHGARVLVSPRGRGGQIATGLAAAWHDWRLILHADTRLSAEWRQAAMRHMASGQDRAGYFHFALDSSHRRARRLERMVGWRCRRLALPYGDQGLLIHRDLLADVGGMRPLQLMEDVDLIRRLGRSRLTALNATATTSAAKWERDGWTGRSARNLACLTLWFAGLPPAAIARLYHRQSR
jgi:rSAM/selenodomain-associated transferase 2